MYNTYTLSNGLRIIQLPFISPKGGLGGAPIYCGYAINAGTRDELEGEEGLAHFCEHGSFKGTKRRTARQVISTLENVGGELNAYTNKESTVYHCSILQNELPRAIDLLTDMVFHSEYPDAELEKEKDVICDEIESYNDSPADLIYDEFENIIFQGHPLGHNILGSKETVRSFNHDSARRFTQRNYRPDNAIFFIYGGDDINYIVRLIDKQFKRYPIDKLHAPNSRTNKILSPSGGAAPRETMGFEGSVKTLEIGRDSYSQSHYMIGCRAYDINHPRRIALYLINNILGGPAMTSRLNLSLRERHGLVYSVESMMTSYKDTGLWTVYFACDAHDVSRCKHLVRRELDKLINTPLTEKQLQQAKRQLKGQIALAADDRCSFALDFAKSFLHYGWQKDITTLYSQIDALTSIELQEVAQELFPQDNLTELRF